MVVQHRVWALASEKKYTRTIATLYAYSQSIRSSNSQEIVVVSPTNVVTDLMDRADLGTSSKSTYRSALGWFFKSQLHKSEYVSAMAVLQSYGARERMAGKEQRMKLKASPLGQRQVVLPEHDLHLLLEELTEMAAKRSIWAARALNWMMAGLATGIRPGQWPSVHWVDEGKTLLRVIGSNGKKAPPPRVQDASTSRMVGLPVWGSKIIAVVSSGDRRSIDAHMDAIRDTVLSGQIDITTYRDRCAIVLWRACKKLWGCKKSYTLFSACKQFAASQAAQRAARTTQETACLPVHSSTLRRHSSTSCTSSSGTRSTSVA